ncbi:MAG: GC-type dockerin domain-anchored protein, partial [Planctomyces sp.]
SNSIAAPANDDFCSATPVGEGAFPFSNCGATTDGPVASCVGDNGFGKDVWFRYTPTVSGIVEISNCGSNFDTMLGVYSGTCPSGFGTLITCNDDACGLSSRVSFSAIAGQPVSIRVAGLGLSRGGSGTLVIRPRQCSPADITNTDGDNPGFPDSAVDNGDFSSFFSAFFLPASDPLRLMADIANTDGDTYLQGAGADGVVDNGDFSAFFSYFFLGCPLP